MLLDDYRRSLKMPEAEEIFDLILFRPLGYICAKAMSHTVISPNQVTALSLVVGLSAAWAFSMGTAQSLAWGVVFLGLANVLDCADGQLARLQQSGTQLGRVWDGVADYISGIAVFAGIGFGLPDSDWPLVVATGLSSGFHSMVFDRYQSAFIAHVNTDHPRREIDRFTGEVERMDPEKRDGVKVLFLRIYLVYLRLQEKFGTAQGAGVHAERMVRLWSFLGPTTNRTFLMISALFGRIDVYLWGITIVGNTWIPVCFFLQKNLQRS